MRGLLTVLAMTFLSSVFGQLRDHEKVNVYLTTSGRVYTRGNVDRIRGIGDQYVGIKKIRVTSDSVYNSIILFDKTEVAERYQRDGYYCGNSERKTMTELKQEFPYNRTYVVKVVSFQGYDSIPKTSGKIDFRKMFEVRTLNEDLMNKMLDILANYHDKDMMMEIAFCWEPKNGVVLLDKSDNVISYIDLCFRCQQFEMYPKSAHFGSFCNEKMDAIQGIMKSAGITYGVNEK